MHRILLVLAAFAATIFPGRADDVPPPWTPAYPYTPAPTMTADETQKALTERFQIGSAERTFSLDKPTYLKVYTEAEKAAQRAQGKVILAAILKAARGGASGYTIPPGVFRLPGNTLNFAHVHDFTLNCAGVDFITEDSGFGRIQVLGFDRCKDVTVRGPATWDSEPLAYVEGKIVAVDPAAGTYDLEVLDGYPLPQPPAHKRFIYFDPQGNILSWAQMSCQRIDALQGRQFRVAVGAGSYWQMPMGGQRQYRVGNIVAMERFDGAFASWNDSENMSLEDISCYAGCCHLVERRTRGYSLSKNCRAIPEPGTNRLVGGQPAQYVIDAGAIVYDGCEFCVGWDDGINLLSGFDMVSRQTGPRELEISKHGFDPLPGTTLTFYDFDTFNVLATAKVVSVEPATDQSAIPELNAFCKVERIREQAGEILKVTLDQDVQVSPHAMVESSVGRADDVVVRNSHWTDMDAQVLLLQGARHGLIENNFFERGAGTALHMGFSTYWWEGPVPSDFVVRNNIAYDNPAYLPTPGVAPGTFCVVPSTTHDTDTRIVHHVLIEGNKMVRSSCSGIYVRNADDVRILNNTIVDPMPQPLIDEHGRQQFADSAGIYLYAVSNATVSGNTIDLTHSTCPEAIHLSPNIDSATVKVMDNTIIPKAP